MPKKKKIVQRLLEEGFFPSEKEAEGWILAGSVYAGQTRAQSAGQLVPAEAPIRVAGLDRKYVGRGGYKLEGAIERLPFEVRGKAALDCGASTGGFTDCLLRHGAAKVYAVDVGFGQLHGSLRLHPGVVNLERVNLGDPELLALAPRPDIATLDLSYLSLEKAIPIAGAILGGQGDAACLVKPLFEIPSSLSRRTGVIESEESYRELLRALCRFVRERGDGVFGVCPSPIRGGKNSVEFFLGVRFGGGGLSDGEIEDRIENAMRNIAPEEK